MFGALSHAGRTRAMPPDGVEMIRFEMQSTNSYSNIEKLAWHGANILWLSDTSVCAREQRVQNISRIPSEITIVADPIKSLVLTC
jgi:hypothetical protein